MCASVPLGHKAYACLRHRASFCHLRRRRCNEKVVPQQYLADGDVVAFGGVPPTLDNGQVAEDPQSELGPF